MTRRLPIGIQDFVSIRKDGFLYVDKTARIHELVTGSGKVFFLSRPRRFGKSLLCSTLGALFEGRRELFGSMAGQPPLAIDSLDWEWKTHPVIRIDLNTGDYEKGTEELSVTIKRMLELCAGKYDVPFTGETLSDFFARLIFSLHEKYKEKVVVLIDEYDKPLLSTIDMPEKHGVIRNALKSFYGVLKSSDEYLQLVFLTGVTKFAHVSVFSDLNNVTDISMIPRFYDLCGITQEELERDFAGEIAAVLEDKHTDRQSYLAEVKRFYNGYRFSEKPETVYNPFGLLNHFNEEGKFNAYWFATGTPTFLITLIEKQKIDILNLEKERVTGFDFQRFDVENMDAVPVLYQSGYLTIVGYDEELGEYALDYPNEEVRGSFAEALLDYYVKKYETGIKPSALAVPKALLHGD
ncbi:MAG: AAA family ATPase, partial [Treponema sp.]|nr:AAA family ATPase [Treponema sp.]